MELNAMQIRVDISKVKEDGSPAFSDFVAQFEAQKMSFCNRVISTIEKHIPPTALEFEVALHLVPHARADAYVEITEGPPYIIIDLSSFLAKGDQETWANLFAAAYHECWHIAFLRYVEDHWRVRDPFAVQDPDYELVFTILNEGYAHYLSLLAYGNGKEGAHQILISRNADDAGDGFFQRFFPKIEEFNKSNAVQKKHLIHESHIGRMWGKWGALTGALVVSTLYTRLDHRRVLESLNHDPYLIWFLYQATCEEDQKLSDQFFEIVDAARSREERGLFDSLEI